MLLSLVWQRHVKVLQRAAVVVLLIFSNPWLQQMVSNAWEVPITYDSELPDVEVGVVLGGYAAYDTASERISFRFGGDRINQGIKLLQTKQVDRLILSGGSGFVTRPDLKEALYVADYLDDIKVPMRKVWIESESKNTNENAINTKRLLTDKGLENESVLLITSGFHMPRAIACFEKQGMKVIPYSVDSRVSRNYSIADLIPSVEVLSYWNVLIHEWVGYISYWVMGYV
ncbi:MAG: YdcF family protein [Salibacteraceae bacterium]